MLGSSGWEGGAWNEGEGEDVDGFGLSQNILLAASRRLSVGAALTIIIEPIITYLARRRTRLLELANCQHASDICCRVIRHNVRK